MHTNGADHTPKTQEQLRKIYESLLEQGAKDRSNVSKNLDKLREMVIIHGLPLETPEERHRTEDQTTLRGRIWKILLGVTEVNAQLYRDLVEKVCTIV